MFRDLKEYQEIAKIYADKVSKPEELDENARAEAAARRREIQNKNKPKTRAEVGLPPKKQNFDKRREARGSSYRGKPEPKPMPTTAEIRAKDKAAGGTGMSNIPKAEGNAVIDGKKLNPNFGKKSEIKTPEPKKSFKDKFIKKDKGVGFVKRGTPGAQRAENKEKNKMRAQEMAKARLAKKAEMANEEVTPYDIVLEYLLASEQAATIEEANYIMTEMDAETIQSIVAE